MGSRKNWSALRLHSLRDRLRGSGKTVKSSESRNRKLGFEPVEPRMMLSGLPIVTSLNPISGPSVGGTTVTITGVNSRHTSDGSGRLRYGAWHRRV